MLITLLIISIVLSFCAIQLAPFYPKISDVMGVVGVTTMLIILLASGFDFVTQ